MRSVLIYPDDRLRVRAIPVSDFGAALQELVSELKQAMEVGPGGVGIAAPQIGAGIRLVIVDCSMARRPCPNHGLLIMVNPAIRDAEGETIGREGCLSVPDWVGMVARAKWIHVSFQDQHGQWHQLDCQGFEARVIQHEVDHLEGVLFIDRLISTSELIRRIDTQSGTVAP